MATDTVTFKAVIARNGYLFKDTIIADSLAKAKLLAESKVSKLNKRISAKHEYIDLFTLVNVDPVTVRHGKWVNWVYHPKGASHPYFEGDPLILVRFRDGSQSHRKKKASRWTHGDNLFKWDKVESPNDIIAYTILAPYNVWLPINTAPVNGTTFVARLKDGTVHKECHWASDLSGEYQPPFEGWFVANEKSYTEIHPIEWLLPLNHPEENQEPPTH